MSSRESAFFVNTSPPRTSPWTSFPSDLPQIRIALIVCSSQIYVAKVFQPLCCSCCNTTPPPLAPPPFLRIDAQDRRRDYKSENSDIGIFLGFNEVTIPNIFL
ncbi:hypothetical protein S245_001247 [Arachis hypogaea]